MSFNKSKTEQDVDNSTKITTENKQVGASEGSTAIGAGSSNITIERIDDDVLRTATDAIGASTNLAGDSLKANVLTVGRSLDSIDNVINNNTATTKAAFEFSGGVTKDALSEVGDTVEQANALLSKSFEQSSNILARNAGVRGADEVGNDKTALYIVGGVAAAVLLSTLKAKK